MISRILAGLFVMALLLTPFAALPDHHEAGEKAEMPAVEAGDMQPGEEADAVEGATGEPAEGAEQADEAPGDEAAPE